VSATAIIDNVWEGATDTWQWLRGVVLGEWEDNRSLSQVTTDALAGFVPGFGSTIALRDLLAVTYRLAKYPDRRRQVDEWILLVAMLLPLLITVVGFVADGVGALVGAELGGFFRAVSLLLVKKGGVGLKALVEFFNAHGYGDVIKALRQVKFAAYQEKLLAYMDKQLNRLIRLVSDFEARLKALSPESLPHWLPGRQSVINGIAHCQVFASELQELCKIARQMIPAALIEMDRRLGAILAGDIRGAAQVTHSMAAGRDAPAAAKLKAEPGQPAMHNPEPPEPGNTRRVPERRLMHVVGKREYRYVGEGARPVGAKPYVPGETKLENPALEEADWLDVREKVNEGWPNLANE
jgi:hypothetical protein